MTKIQVFNKTITAVGLGMSSLVVSAMAEIENGRQLRFRGSRGSSGVRASSAARNSGERGEASGVLDWVFFGFYMALILL